MTLRADNNRIVSEPPFPTTHTDIADGDGHCLAWQVWDGGAITLTGGSVAKAHDTTEVPPNTHPSVPDTGGGRHSSRFASSCPLKTLSSASGR
jgi:hypothetical protein